MDLTSLKKKNLPDNHARNIPSSSSWNKMLNKILLQYFCTSACV